MAAALLLGESRYGLLINLSVLVLALSVPAMLYPALVLDRARRAGLPEA
jgi:hypothetical protein